MSLFSNTSSVNEKEEDNTAEFRECVRVLAEKVAALSRNRAELHERCLNAEAANKQLTKELEEKKELVNALYKKHQLEKQVTHIVFDGNCILLALVSMLHRYIYYI